MFYKCSRVNDLGNLEIIRVIFLSYLIIDVFILYFKDVKYILVFCECYILNIRG